MRVLQLVKTSVGATWAYRQMRELVKLGVEVHAALPPGGPLIPLYEQAGVRVYPLQTDFPTRAPWRAPALFNQLHDLVSSVAPDIIHSHFVGTTLTMRLALRNHPVKRVFQVPGPLHLEHPFFRRAELAVATQQDYWIGSCRWTCDRYRQSGIAKQRIFLSYYGIDLDSFTAHPPGKLRAELGLEPDTKIVGMVAYMYAPKRYLGQRRGLKGHEDLIDALAICRQHDPHIKGVLIGGAWNKAQAYEARVRAYGQQQCGDHIYFLGTRQDVAQLYPDFDVVCHPSYSENVGGAAESLPMGIPTIATNVGGLPDLVIDGQTGWLVPPRDPPRLAQAILEALRDPQHARRLALEGQKLSRELFDIRHTASTALEAYQKILST